MYERPLELGFYSELLICQKQVCTLLQTQEGSCLSSCILNLLDICLIHHMHEVSYLF